MTGRRAIAAVGVLLGTLAAPACGQDPFTEPLTLGGQVISAETLNQGRHVFERYCATCHAYDGTADTPAARRLDPRPRDLTRADFKFVATPGTLPTDDELRDTIRNGIPRSGMPAWPNLSARDVSAVLHYLKVFSPRWRQPDKARHSGVRTRLQGSETAASFRPGSTQRHATNLAWHAAGPPQTDISLASPSWGGLTMRPPERARRSPFARRER